MIPEKENPILSDYVFKRVFGQRDNDPVLISFLNAMLNGDYNIEEVEIVNSEYPRMCDINRTVLLDVHAYVGNGTFIDVEVQRSYKPDLLSRMFIYGAEMVTRYSFKATPFNSTKCIAIWILDCQMKDFSIFKNDPIIGEFNFRSQSNPSLYLPLDELRIYPVELKKGSLVNALTPIKETWINFLNTSSDISKPEEIKEVHSAYTRMLETTGTTNYRAYVKSLEKSEQIKDNDIYWASKEAEEKGREEGREEGVRTTQMKAVDNLSNMGFSPDQIAEALGISEDEVFEMLDCEEENE